MDTVALDVTLTTDPTRVSGRFQRTGSEDAFHTFEFQGKSRTIFRRLVRGVRQETWTIKFEREGKQVLHNLQATSRKEAVDRAKLKLRAAEEGRWDALAKSKARLAPETPMAGMEKLLEVYREGIAGRTKIQPRTIGTNISALRVTVEAVLEKKLERVSSADVCTGALLKRFKELRMAAGANVTTINSTMTQARAVFSKPALELYKDRGLKLPDMKDFLAVRKFENDQDVSYRPMGEKLLALMEENMAKQEAGLRLIYLLGRKVGMRAREMWCAQRSWIEDWSAGGGYRVAIIRRAMTPGAEAFKPKGRERWVPVTAAVREELLRLADEAAGEAPTEFLLPGPHKTARRTLVERRANAWIRKFLPAREKGIHELRKQAGSEIATRDGLMAARDWLGHASIATTEAHYATLLSPLKPL
jgi:integrase